MTATFDIAGATAVGHVREANEDAFLVAHHPDPAVAAARGQLVVVADGMGGAVGGGTASRLAVHTLAQAWYAEVERPIAEALVDAVHAANAAVYRHAAAEPGLRGMGSTLTALVLVGGQAWVAHVGDSRAYRVRQGHAEQLTRDHSRVGLLVESGAITPEQAANHPERNVILRSLGPHPSVDVDLDGPLEVEPDDAFLLCSDGLHGHVSRAELGPLLAGTPERAAERLVQLALDRGGHDNITAVVAVRGHLPPERAESRAPRRGGRVAAAVLLVLLGGGLWWALGPTRVPLGPAVEGASPARPLPGQPPH